MKRLLGVCHHSPYIVEELLTEWAATSPNLTWTTVFLGEKPGKIRTPVVVCVTHKVLDQLIASGKAKGKSIILIDSPVFCCNYKNLVLLDALRKKKFLFTFTTLTVDLLKQAFRGDMYPDVEKHTIDVIPTLLQDMPSSVLHHVQTFLYKIADVDKRSRYQYEIFCCIRDGKPLKSLEWTKAKNCATLLDWESSPEGRNSFALLGKALNSKIRDYDKLELEFGVAKFDIRYALMAIRKSEVLTIEKTTSELFEERKSVSAKPAPEVS